jgi:hypothetical protein
MSLPDDIRVLADRILLRVSEARDFYRHTRRAWRLVHEVAVEGRSVGIINEASGQELSAPDLVNLGCPDENRRGALSEMKATRDVLEHNRGRVGPDYLEKAGALGRYAVGDVVQIDEPYLMQCLALMRDVVEAMAVAAIRRSSGSRSA